MDALFPCEPRWTRGSRASRDGCEVPVLAGRGGQGPPRAVRHPQPHEIENMESGAVSSKGKEQVHAGDTSNGVIMPRTVLTAMNNNEIHGFNKNIGRFDYGKENLPPNTPWSKTPEYRRQYQMAYRARKKAELKDLHERRPKPVRAGAGTTVLFQVSRRKWRK